MKKASKNTNAKRGASKRTMWIIMAVVLIPAAIIFWNIAGRPLAAQASMKRYLEDKYKDKFVVERPEHKNGGLGVRGSWKSHSYPVSNPKLKFYVGCDIACNDEYLDSYFSRQEYERLQLSMKTMGVTEYSVRLIIKNEVLKYITKDSNLDIIKRKYDPIYKLRIKISEANNEDDSTSKISDIIEDIYKQGVSRVEIDYTLIAKDKKVYKCATGYDTVSRLNYETIKQCLKEG